MNGRVSRLFAVKGLFRPKANGVSSDGRFEPPLRTSGVVAIEDADAPWRWQVAGVINAIAIDPRGDLPSIEARVSDGTGWLVAKWRGWTTLRGLSIRRLIILEGFVDIGPEGQKLMFEPDFQIIPDG
jgi:hypothetical protein